MFIRIPFSYLLIFSLLLVLISAPYSFAGTSEIEVLKKRMEEMETEMIRMKNKITELERKNRLITEDMEPKTDPEDVDIKTAQPAGRDFFGNISQTFNPDINLIGLFAGSWYSQDEPQGLAEADPDSTGIGLQEIEIGFQSIVDPYFKFDNFISLGDHVEVEEAYATTLISLPANSQLRAGIMRSKFGRINTKHRHNQNFVTLPLAATEFLGEHFNPASLEANFLLPLPWYMELTAAGGSPNVETASFERDGNSNDLSKLLYTFRLANFFEIGESLGLLLGGSFATGTNNTAPGNRTNLYGADFFAKYRPERSGPYKELQLQSEFMYRDAETEETGRQDWGLYAQAVYRFAKRWHIGARYELTDTDDPVMTIMEDEHEHEEEMHEEDEHEHEEDEHEEDEHEHEEEMLAAQMEEDGHAHGTGILGLLGKRQRVSTMLTFSPTEFSRIRLEYGYMDQNFDKNQHGIFLQFQYAIGQHGAHPF